MKKESDLLNSIGILVGAVIAILAIVRGIWQTRLLITVFTLWLAWAAVKLLLPYIRAISKNKKFQKQRLLLQQNTVRKPVTFEIPALRNISTEQLLLLHVNHRISMYLRCSYGEVTWEWCEDNPVKLIMEGGHGRIKVYGISDYDHADVKLNVNGDIRFDMMRIVPLNEIVKETPAAQAAASEKPPLDPQIWYEVQARSILESIVNDLHSRGHSQLMLNEDGDIFIEQDEEDVAKEHLSNFPAIVYWPRLVQVLEGEGLSAKVEDKKIIVSW